MIQRDLIRSLRRGREGPSEEFAEATASSPGQDWQRSWMPPGHTEIKRDLALGLRTLGLSFLQDGWVTRLQLPVFPDARCFGQEGTPGSGWPGRGRQAYSLGVQGGTGSEAEACSSPRIV